MSAEPGDFFIEPLAESFEPDAKRTFRIFLGVGEKHGEILRDGFVDPLVTVTGPANDVAPPLMRDFVIGNDFGEMLPGQWMLSPARCCASVDKNE